MKWSQISFARFNFCECPLHVFSRW